MLTSSGPPYGEVPISRTVLPSGYQLGTMPAMSPEDDRVARLEAHARYWQAEYEYLVQHLPNAVFLIDPTSDRIVEANEGPAGCSAIHGKGCSKRSGSPISTLTRSIS